MDQLFEKAARIKLRFETERGMLTVEDIFDLPLTARNGALDLDTVAKNLSRQVKDTSEESFVVEQTKVNEELQLGFDIVKHVIAVKKDERDAAKIKAEKTAKKQMLLEALAKKQTEGISNMSEEQIQAALAEL